MVSVDGSIPIIRGNRVCMMDVRNVSVPVQKEMEPDVFI